MQFSMDFFLQICTLRTTKYYRTTVILYVSQLGPFGHERAHGINTIIGTVGNVPCICPKKGERQNFGLKWTVQYTIKSCIKRLT